MFSLQLSTEARAAARVSFQAQARPAALVPGVVPAAWAAQLRSRLEEGWRASWLAHRGRYEVNESLQAPALLDALQEACEAISGVALVLRAHRWVRFRRGSYALLRDDPPGNTAWEAQLDLSERPVPGAEVCYSAGRQVYFVVPPAPGALSLVARGADTQRFARYLTHAVGEASLVRLQAWWVPHALAARPGA